MQSLSIQVSIGLILVLVASALASEDADQGEPSSPPAADSTPTAYGEGEWRQMLDKIKYDRYNKYIEVEAMKPTDTRDIIERLLIQVPEKSNGEQNWLKEYLDISYLDETKCSIDYLYRLYKLPRDADKIHLEEYLGHYISKQLYFCRPVVVKDMEVKLGQVEAVDKANLLRLGSFMPRDLYDTYNFEVKKGMIAGIVNYMRAGELGKKKVFNFNCISNSRNNFDKKFKVLILDVCERANSQVGKQLLDGYMKFRKVVSASFFLALGEGKKFMDLNSMCRFILDDKDDLEYRVYKEFTRK